MEFRSSPGSPPRPRGPTHVDSASAAHIWVLAREVQILTSLRIFAFAAAAFGLVFGTSAEATERPLKIIAFGNSLTAGYGLPANEAFPAKLQQALAGKGINVDIVNAGVSGDTTSGGLARLDWSVPADADAVILELGANDAMRGVDPAVTRKALRRDVAAPEAARDPGPPLRHVCPAQHGGRVRASLSRHVSGFGATLRRDPLSVLPRSGRRPEQNSIRPTASTPPPGASIALLTAFCRRSRS